MSVPSDLIERARAVDIMFELQRRGVSHGGKWRYRRVGSAKELVGPCPKCGGHDRFSAHMHKQVFNCRGCGKGGNVIALVQWLDGVSFREAVQRLAGGTVTIGPVVINPKAALLAEIRADAKRGIEELDRARNQERAGRWWDEAAPIWGTLAERYLVDTRKLVLPPDLSPRVLRFHPNCQFGQELLPCLLALFRDIRTNKPTGILRTALGPDGRKADIEKPKRSLGSVGGAAIKLVDDCDVTAALTIGEGLETVLSGRAVGLWPAWALGSVVEITKFPVLGGVDVLNIHCERCPANEKAVRECADRWHMAGRDVWLAEPKGQFKDLNDAIVARARKETASV